MMHTHKTCSHWLISLLAAVCCMPAWAQPPAPNAATDIGAPVVETNPAVRAALELPRREPADYFQAVLWLIDLGRPELAKPILDELMQLEVSDAQRVALVGQFGSRAMLRLARTDELAPAGAEFADACMAAASAAATDPQRIAALVAQLSDPSSEVRQMARTDLAATGQPGVVATLEALAKETDPDRRGAIANAAAQMHPLVVGPLLAMLDTDERALRADVAELLEYLRVPQAAPLVEASPAAAERALRESIARYAQGTAPFAVDALNQVELWHWDDAAKQLTSARYPAGEARTIWMSRLAGELTRLRPENRQYQRQAIMLELEADALVPATHRSPAIERLASADTRVLNDVLMGALRANYGHAAVAVADALGQRGDVGVLFTADAQPSPLADALVHPNRRVRFAALRAIVTLDPASPYPGSSRVPEALTWFAASTGARQVVVAMPTNAMATNLAGMLIGLGFEAQATNRGREAVDLARDAADLEMIFLDMNLIAPDIRQVLYELRISATTGQIPIALMAAEGRLEAAQRLAAEHQRVVAVPRPHSPEVLARIVEQLANQAGRDAVPPDERVAQAEQAAVWLAKLSAGNRPFYKFRRTSPLNTIESRQPRSGIERPALLPKP